ncbi:hypothetical protein M3J09_002738 [Ascochyta lentis]
MVLPDNIHQVKLRCRLIPELTLRHPTPWPAQIWVHLRLCCLSGKQTSTVVMRSGIPACLLRQTMKISQVVAWSQGSTNGRLDSMVTTASQRWPVRRGGQHIHGACISGRFGATSSSLLT